MSQSFKVVITDFITGDLSPEQTAIGDIATITALDAFSEADLIGKIEDADAVMLYHNLALTAATIERLQKCKLIVRCGVGYDNVDRVLARKKGIAVANVPDYGTEEVADSAIGLMLTLTRGIHQLNSLLRDKPGSPWTYLPVAPLYRLRGRVFGVLGLGRIGTAAALRAKALGMRVVFYDPLVNDGLDKALGVTRVESLDELLAASDVLSCHTPLTPTTRHIIDAAAIAKLKRGSYLVNTSRGAVVDTSAIPDAIASGHLAGAGIDVLAVEPPTEDNPLIKAWRDPKHPCHHYLIVNPHSAFYSVEGLLDMRVKGSATVRNALLGKPMRNIVN
ncbi:C-terminal binding protein [Zavarzinella formosa]|uniref:C-terminal binding protein n=1 Tax=Zavarzinella formosa TaxID=360055 RepID=UPI00030792FC|nr:C-terminal binding protein [Zavarzinella formosa]